MKMSMSYLVPSFSRKSAQAKYVLGPTWDNRSSCTLSSFNSSVLFWTGSSTLSQPALAADSLSTQVRIAAARSALLTPPAPLSVGCSFFGCSGCFSCAAICLDAIKNRDTAAVARIPLTFIGPPFENLTASPSPTPSSPRNASATPAEGRSSLLKPIAVPSILVIEASGDGSDRPPIPLGVRIDEVVERFRARRRVESDVSSDGELDPVRIKIPEQVLASPRIRGPGGVRGIDWYPAAVRQIELGPAVIAGNSPLRVSIQGKPDYETCRDAFRSRQRHE